MSDEIIPSSRFLSRVYRNIPGSYALPVTDESKPRPPLAKTIRRLRDARGLDQTELGALMNVQQGAVSKWENGGLMDVDDLPRLAVTLGATLDTLMAGIDPDYDAFVAGRRQKSPKGTPGNPFLRAILRVAKTLEQDQQLVLLNVARSYVRERRTAPGSEQKLETSASRTPTQEARPRRAGRGKRGREK